MKNNKNEEMFQEMLNDNFVELSRDEVEDINGGKFNPAVVVAYGIGIIYPPIKDKLQPFKVKKNKLIL